MPYHTVHTLKHSLCGDPYIEINVVYDEVIDVSPMPQAEVDTSAKHVLLGKQVYENPSQNSRILDPDWDTIPF